LAIFLATKAHSSRRDGAPRAPSEHDASNPNARDIPPAKDDMLQESVISARIPRLCRSVQARSWLGRSDRVAVIDGCGSATLAGSVVTVNVPPKPSGFDYHVVLDPLFA
jgi:hypothetical protein